MTEQQVRVLPKGLYLLLWKSGGHSEASVGLDQSGRHWYAPVNWVSVPSYDWSKVQAVERVAAPPLFDEEM